MAEEYIQFKRGCVYKSLKDFSRMDPDCFRADDWLFSKNCIYRCEKDGTLNACGGTYKDEKMPIEYEKDFVLVGHYDYKLRDSELRKKAMQEAYEKRYFDFDKFYSAYCEILERLDEENDKIDEKTIRYIDGQVGQYFNKYGSVSESLI